MEIYSRTTSSLNPHAAPYVPKAQRAVEDFSPEWWQLVHSSPSFTDYWLRECFNQDYDEDYDVNDDDDEMLPDDLVDDFFYSPQQEKIEEKERTNGELKVKKLDERLITWGSEKWMGYRRDNVNLSPKYAEKAPKIVNVKVSPKTIQQPK